MPRSLTLGALVALSLAGCADDPAGAGGASVSGMRRRRRRRRRAGNAAGNYLAGRGRSEAGDLRSAAESSSAALAAAPGNDDLRRQVFELRLAAASSTARWRRPAIWTRAAPPPTRSCCCWRWTLPAAGNTGPPCPVRAPGAANIAGPVQPMLLAWARFAGGSRTEAIEALATPDPNAGLQRLRAFHRAPCSGWTAARATV